MRRTRARIILGCFSLVFGVLVWIGFAPAALGGSVTYATTFGTSMEPRLHAGDLVLLRTQSAYKVGDVVGYRDPKLDRLVLHRIVGGGPDGYTLKGDNNAFLDPAHPAAAHIKGRLSVRVPLAGTAIENFRAPMSAAVLVGGLALLPVRRRRRRSAADDPDDVPSSEGASWGVDPRLAAVGALGLLCLLLAGLAALAYSRPTSEAVTITDAYRQDGTFTYQAVARKGAAYPDGLVRTGQAVFPRLSRAVTMTFDYRLTSAEALTARGQGRLDAVLSDGQGWSRTIPLGAPTTFSGTRATLSGVLRLDELRRITSALQRETGARGGEYTVTISPHIDISGRAGAGTVKESFAPSLPLRLDATRLALATSPTGQAPNLVPSRPGSTTRMEQASISLAGVSVPVFRARAIGLLGFEVALGALILLGLPLLVRSRRSPPDVIRARAGRRIVQVVELPWSAPGGCVDLLRGEDLIRIASDADVPILAVDHDGGARYAAVRAGVLYRYSARPPDAPSPPQLAAPTPVAA